MNNAFKPADILVPKKSVDMNNWSVIACDQYTSEPEYWKQTSKIVGQNYSSLNLILPEIYLEDENVKENRLAILTLLKAKYNHLADFSRL